MKRRITVFIALFISILSLFAVCLGGCKSVGASYKKGSFEVTDFYFESRLREQFVTYQADFKVSKKGDYKFNFTAYGWYGKDLVWEKEVSNRFSVDEFTADVKKSYRLENVFSVPTVLDATDVTIRKVSVTVLDTTVGGKGNDYYAIAIAFGVFSALLLGGLIALFVLDKKRRIG